MPVLEVSAVWEDYQRGRASLEAFQRRALERVGTDFHLNMIKPIYLTVIPAITCLLIAGVSFKPESTL